MRKLIVLLFVAILIGGAVFVFVNLSPKREDQLLWSIMNCNNAKKEFRFSCYRSSIDKYYAGHVEEFSELIKNRENLPFQEDSDDLNSDPDANNKEITYAIFGTNCHSFYHAAGDFIAVNTPELSITEKLALGTPSCTSGYMMGVFKRTALMKGYSLKTLSDFIKVCGDYGTHQCSHEIGHILHDKYTYSILKILDDISATEYNFHYKQKFKYVTFKKNDLNAPFEECRKILPDSEYAYCYTGIGHNLFLFADFAPNGFKKVFNECDHVKEENKENCHGFIIYRIGQNEAAPRILSGKLKEGVKVCEDAIKLSGAKNIRDHCYLGIGGGIGLFADSEFADFNPTEENVKAARVSMHKYIDYCKSFDDEDEEDCIAGLFGTPFKKLYQKFLIIDEAADAVLKKIDKDFQVVG